MTDIYRRNSMDSFCFAPANWINSPGKGVMITLSFLPCSAWAVMEMILAFPLHRNASCSPSPFCFSSCSIIKVSIDQRFDRIFIHVHATKSSLTAFIFISWNQYLDFSLHRERERKDWKGQLLTGINWLSALCYLRHSTLFEQWGHLMSIRCHLDHAFILKCCCMFTCVRRPMSQLIVLCSLYVSPCPRY